MFVILQVGLPPTEEPKKSELLVHLLIPLPLTHLLRAVHIERRF